MSNLDETLRRQAIRGRLAGIPAFGDILVLDSVRGGPTVRARVLEVGPARDVIRDLNAWSETSRPTPADELCVRYAFEGKAGNGRDVVVRWETLVADGWRVERAQGGLNGFLSTLAGQRGWKFKEQRR